MGRVTTTTQSEQAASDHAPAAPSPSIVLPPRIAYVAYPSSLTRRAANAVQTYATCAALQAIAPRFELIVPRFAFRPSDFTEIGATHVLRIPFNVGRNILPTIGWSYAERTWFAARVLVRLVRRRLTGNAAEVIYVRDAVTAAWLALLARPLTGARVVYEVHDLEIQNPSAKGGRVMRRFIRWVDRTALRRADGVVSLTATFAALLQSLPDVRPRPPVAVIPDAYDETRFFPRDRTTARVALDLPAPPFVVVYTGLTWAYHGVDRVVDAFALFHAEAPDALLVLVGGRDAERDAIRAQVAAHGIADAVRIVPPQSAERIAQYIAAADVVVLADTVSKASASPLKLFEYAASARPVVAVDLPALREILPDDAARYVPDGDLVAFADALRWIATHPDDATAMAHRAARAVSPYTYPRRAVAVVAACRSAMEASV